MKQLQQTAAVTGNGDVLLKVVAPFFLKPALAAELSDQETGPAGDITQFLLVDILPFKCCVRQLLNMEYNASSRIFRLSRYALYSTSSASAYSARFGEARGEKSSPGIASKNFMKLPPTGDDNDWTIDLES